MLVDFIPVFALTVCVAVGEEMAPAAALVILLDDGLLNLVAVYVASCEVAAAAGLVILLASGLLLNLAGELPQTVVTFVSGREAVLSGDGGHIRSEINASIQLVYFLDSTSLIKKGEAVGSLKNAKKSKVEEIILEVEIFLFLGLKYDKEHRYHIEPISFWFYAK